MFAGERVGREKWVAVGCRGDVGCTASAWAIKVPCSRLARFDAFGAGSCIVTTSAIGIGICIVLNSRRHSETGASLRWYEFDNGFG